MKQLKYAALLLLLAGCGSTTSVQNNTKASFGKIPDPVPYAQTITAKELREMLFIYAGNEFMGRDTGSKGQKEAVSYIKEQYIQNQIPAAQAGENYLQPVPLKTVMPPMGIFQVLNQPFQIGEDVLTFDSYSKENFDIHDIVYAGFGIDADNYSSYTNLDVEGKTVLIKSGEPMKSEVFVLTGTKTSSKWSNSREAIGLKIEAAKKHGAVGVLFYEQEQFSAYKSQYQRMRENAHGMSLRDKTSDNSFYMFCINQKVAEALLPEIKDNPERKHVDTFVRVQLENGGNLLESENVIAYIEGSVAPDEYIIISAHLDHVGVDKEGNIYNGADDDGSGTVAVMEIAEAFKKAALEGNGPKRSVVFLHVTGEEKGLLGSEYYSKHPIFPLDQTVADLNIDMVGRIDPAHEKNPDYIYLIGSDKLSTELHQISEQMNNKYTNFKLDYTYNDDADPNRFYYRSDHYNFAKHNVPIIFYFNGTHKDYHQPGDTPDKIEYDLLARRAQLVFYTAWQLANQEKTIIADKAN